MDFDDMTINVTLDRQRLTISREVFSSLFEQSVVWDRADVRRALEKSEIAFGTLVKLARTAEIPYPIFFAAPDFVTEQLRLKTEKLMAGFTKTSFSMNSRMRVRLADIELIVKDLVRKQQYLKQDTSLVTNPVVGCLRRTGPSIRQDASRLMALLDHTVEDIKATKSKDAALELIIERVEAKQVLVARSAKNYMPQQIPKRAQFSGLTIKDAKVPYIFLASGDEGDHTEPLGRRVFTLTLMVVLIARGVFAPVTYDSHTKEDRAPREYDLTAEILLPESEIRTLDSGSLEALKQASEVYKVTPSAMVVRARRLQLIDKTTFSNYMDELAEEYSSYIPPPMRSPLPVNALRKYNGTECSRRMLGLLDSGYITRSDFCRVMFSNKLRPGKIDEFRSAVR